ncbi:TPA: WxL domain-containing protein [Enterococcus faecium]
MKNTLKYLLSSAAILATLSTGGIGAFAAEYPDAQTAITEGHVTFEKDTDPTKPVDPVDPEIPVDPVDPEIPNPNPGELAITYASKFDFGVHKADGSKTVAYAKADTVKDGEGTREIVPFVSTKDARGTDREGWSLTVKQNGEFKDTNNNVLTGAEITLSGINYANVAGAPTATATDVVINQAAQEISSANKETGIGNWSVALGQLSGNEGEQVTKGVTLTVPSTTAKNADKYSTTLTWELAADPTK